MSDAPSPAPPAPPDPSARRFSLAACFAQAWHHVPAVLLLTLLTMVAHALHLGDRLDALFMRQAVQHLLADTHDEVQQAVEPDPLRRIHVLEISAVTRIRSLEQTQGWHEADIARAGGVRPIDRAAMARWIDALAARLEAAAPATRPRVVAIDVDVAPLADGQHVAAMRAALANLRQQAHVLVITLARPDADAQRARNQALTTAFACTGATAQAAPHGLYVVSPRLFHRLGEYPLAFPADAKCPRAGCGAHPERFPSLGNAAAWLATGQPATAGFLTQLCREAAGEPPSPLLEDLLEQPAARDTAADPERYRWQRLHWRVLDEDRIRRTRVDDLAELDAEWLQAGILIVGIDGGRGHDKFDGATVDGARVGGATLHALVAASSMPGSGLRESIGSALAVDFGCGLIFVLLWAALKQWPIGWSEARRWHDLAWLCRLLLPAALAAGLGGLVLWRVGPWLLSLNQWANPAYVLLGLTVHAYAEAWSDARSARGAGHGAHGPDFSFGMRALRMRQATGADRWLLPALAVCVMVAGIVAIFHLADASGDPDELKLAWILAAVLVLVVALSTWWRWPVAPLDGSKEAH